MKIDIAFVLDGVLADFDGHYIKLLGVLPHIEYQKGKSKMNSEIITIDGVEYKKVNSIDPHSCTGCVAEVDDNLCNNFCNNFCGCAGGVWKEVKIMKKEQPQLDPHLKSLLLAIVEGKQVQFKDCEKFIDVEMPAHDVIKVVGNPASYRVKPDTVKLVYRLAVLRDGLGDYITTHQVHVHHNTQEEFATRPDFQYWLTETQEVEVEA